MKKREIEILERETLAMERGEIAPGRVWKVTKRADGKVKREAIHPETHRVAQARAWKAKTEAAKIRREINVTQEGFARLLGVSLGTVRKWERGTIQPSGAARTLLRIAAKHPEIVRDAGTTGS
jgi:putative transcriptional regulator